MCIERVEQCATVQWWRISPVDKDRGMSSGARQATPSYQCRAQVHHHYNHKHQGSMTTTTTKTSTTTTKTSTTITLTIIIVNSVKVAD